MVPHRLTACRPPGAYDETGFEMWLRPLLFSFLSILILAPAMAAMERPFPPQAKRGTMSPAAYPQIVIEGKLRRLSPGARIWNRENRIQLPGTLTGGGMKVNYTEDAQGAIDRVWILTSDEASQPLKTQTNSVSQ